MTELLPRLYDMAIDGDLETLVLSFEELKYMPHLGVILTDVDRLAEKLFALKAFE